MKKNPIESIEESWKILSLFTVDSLTAVAKELLIQYFSAKYTFFIEKADSIKCEFLNGQISNFELFINTDNWDSISIQINTAGILIKQQQGHSKFEQEVKIPLTWINVFSNLTAFNE